MCENRVPWLSAVYLRADAGAASRLSEVEVASAFGAPGTTRGVYGRGTRPGAGVPRRRFGHADHCRVHPGHSADARALLLRHRLRAGDAVPLASCLYLQREMSEPLPFVVFDDRLAEAARHEGLTVVPVSTGRR